MPDGKPIHVFERSDEVVEYLYDGKKDGYIKDKKLIKDIKTDIKNNKKLLIIFKVGL